MQEMSAPLKILTLDGSGLQALTTLSILGGICEDIAAQKGVSRVPAPYELFDMIAGVGTGGWLALLLGRYKLDVPSCTAVYMEMAAAIDPQMNGSRCGPKNKAYRLDQSELIAKIKQVLHRYGLNDEILDPEVGEDVRCKYVFAAGPIQSSNKKGVEYQLFRNYQTPARRSQFHRAGPNPKTCKVWQACAATGAAKYFLEPYQVEDTTFFDDKFPAPHPISRLALDEAKHVFGDHCGISTVVNIGPGIPHDADVKSLEEMSTGTLGKLTRKFSWPTGRKWMQRHTSEKTAPFKKTASDLSKEALGLQHNFEDDIKARLRKASETGVDDVYFHLGPEYADLGLSLNDVDAIDASSINTSTVLKSSEHEIHNVAHHLVAAH